MEVAFHFNVSQPTDYCCRLLRKAHARGARVTVTGPRERLQDIDQQLWALSATEFVPHAWADAPAEVLMCSPIVLCETLTRPDPGQTPFRPPRKGRRAIVFKRNRTTDIGITYQGSRIRLDRC